ncbi:hypothetical protein [Paenibacillus contaminans]|uniref:Uncharacterized protein n=1 Tax=Paenibacillus contaminans TaxID=450362 RepID=A0A329MRR5_9BACL|nr:hypothetical protein [Paenibacillus contaminans]RAV22659.1 hypothetical protein DQG23_00110 [Paenibacillus contaminans]
MFREELFEYIDLDFDKFYKLVKRDDCVYVNPETYTFIKDKIIGSGFLPIEEGPLKLLGVEIRCSYWSHLPFGYMFLSSLDDMYRIYRLKELIL